MGISVVLTFFLACSDPGPQIPAGNWANVAPALVTEVLAADGRSYLNIQEGQYQFWVSVPMTEVSTGQYVLLGKGPLKYAERGAGRLFDALTVIEEVAVVDAVVAQAAARLPVVAGGLDIAGIYGQRTALSTKSVKVRGRVVKVAKNIEGTNWYHIQDGSSGPGKNENDLTFTSDGDYAVGQTVILEGPLTIDKDLGFGYFYAALLEKPAVMVEP